MKRGLNKLSWFGLLLLITISFKAFPQSPKAKKNHNQDCGGNCFSAEVLSAAQKGGGCTDYEMKVTHDGSCRYELSHFAVDIPCGKVSNISNSGGWANVIGKDPTTGLTGFKIDGVGNFGKNTPNFFTVKFTYCADSACTSGCWQPRVAFKAATCVDYDTVAVTCGPPPPNNLKATFQRENASCSGKTDGSLLVTVEGGVGPYTYSWSTGCEESFIRNLPAGTYTVTITDADGNEVTVSEEITAPPQIVLSGSTSSPLCFGSTNGSIDLTVAGGVGPYTYIWSTGATTEDLANLGAGSYHVTVLDSAGCSNVAAFQLTNPQLLVSTLLIMPACNGTNGGIDITVTGGTEPYTYLWNTGATSQDLTNVGAGSYSVTVTDANGCTRQSSFLLRENNTLRITFAVTPTGCVGSGTGAIDLAVTGGTTPYAYLWTNGSTSEDLTGLSAGLQRVTVTDANGCMATSNINVFRQTFQVASAVTPPTCPGEADGSISLTPAGVPPYTFLWSTGATTSSISDLTAGTYSVTVTDGTGCSRVMNFPVADPVITISSSVGNLQCGTEGAFTIDLTVTGGTAPFTFLWSNGETTEDLSGLNSGTYNVTITDSNGCSKIVGVVVEPVVVTWSCLIVPPTESPICSSFGNSLGTSVTDADTYAWSVESADTGWVISSGQNSSSIVFMAGGEGSAATFTVTITKDGCMQTCSYRIGSCSPVMACGDEEPETIVSATVEQAETQKGVWDKGTQADVKGTGTQTIVDDSAGKEDKKADSEESPRSKSDFQFVSYPNPVADQLNFGWTADADEYVQLEIVDMRGARVAELYSGHVREGESYSIEWPATNLQDPIYIYHYSSGSRTFHGKLLKR